MNAWLLPLAAGLLAGGMNALAGGGSFVSLPALVAVGIPSVNANATSTAALFPGGVASSWVYRGDLGAVCGVPLLPVAIATIVGGLIGALLLLWTPSSLFDVVLPWLLLVATIMLAFGRHVGPALRARFTAGLPTILALQFALGVYGGYFGGAVGLMMMAVWNVLDDADIKALNAPRTLMVTAANGIAVLCFAAAGAIVWASGLAMAVGAIAGGWGGAHLARRLPATVVRTGTVLLAITTTTIFFARAFA